MCCRCRPQGWHGAATWVLQQAGCCTRMASAATSLASVAAGRPCNCRLTGCCKTAAVQWPNGADIEGSGRCVDGFAWMRAPSLCSCCWGALRQRHGRSCVCMTDVATRELAGRLPQCMLRERPGCTAAGGRTERKVMVILSALYKRTVVAHVVPVRSKRQWPKGRVAGPPGVLECLQLAVGAHNGDRRVPRCGGRRAQWPQRAQARAAP